MRFKIGDVCAGKNATWDLIRGGMGCVVTGDFGLRTYWTNAAHTAKRTHPCYLVLWDDGKEGCAGEDQLELKRQYPVSQEVGEWALCPWQPERSQVTVGADKT